jgi:hypothetical protein
MVYDLTHLLLGLIDGLPYLLLGLADCVRRA